MSAPNGGDAQAPPFTSFMDLALAEARAAGQRRLADRRRNRLQRGARGDNHSRQRHEGQHHPADQRGRSRHAEKVEQHGEAEQPEDERRHRGEIIDVDLNDVGESAAGGKLL